MTHVDFTYLASTVSGHLDRGLRHPVPLPCVDLNEEKPRMAMPLRYGNGLDKERMALER